MGILDGYARMANCCSYIGLQEYVRRVVTTHYPRNLRQWAANEIWLRALEQRKEQRDDG